jgi:prepilin-type N-terminal cleavage/methylation domain-containing protein
MQHQSTTREHGFTLVELLISLALGFVVLAAAVEMYSKATKAAFTVTQQAQMQQDARASQDLLAKDLSLAGAGLNHGGVALATGTGTSPRYGCDQNLCYPNNGAGVNFPCVGAGCVPTLYAVMPGFQMGPTINAAQGPTDVVSITYLDTDFALSCYTAAFANPAGTLVTFTNPAAPATACTDAVNDPAKGLKVGDLVLFSGTVAGATAYAIGEVTGIAGAVPGPYTITFASADPLRINQLGAATGTLAAIATAGGTVNQGSRLLLITYFVSLPPAPNPPRLMRQVNGLAPIPVADNIADFQLSYDIYDDTKVPPRSTKRDAGMSAGQSPNLVRKINVEHLTFRTEFGNGKQGYQGLDLRTAVSARNLGFTDRYPIQ